MTPTEPGWYWAKHDAATIRRIVEVGSYVDGHLYVVGFNDLAILDFSDWSAKIPDPGPGGEMNVIPKESMPMLPPNLRKDSQCTPQS